MELDSLLGKEDIDLLGSPLVPLLRKEEGIVIGSELGLKLGTKDRELLRAKIG